MVDLHRFTLPEDQNPRLLTSNLDLLLAANDASASPRISEDLVASPRAGHSEGERMCTAVLQSLQLWLSGADCWNVISVSVRCRPVCSLIIGRRGGAFAARRGAWESAFEPHTRLSKRSETPYFLCFSPGKIHSVLAAPYVGSFPSRKTPKPLHILPRL